MNFLTESLDWPQNEQRRCRSWDIEVMDRGRTSRDGGLMGDERDGDASVSTLDAQMSNSPPNGRQETPCVAPLVKNFTRGYFVAASAPFGSCTGCVMTLSMIPYVFASSADMKKSRSMSRSICSTGRPVCFA